ncbi:hypothetical protein CRD59_01335 [Bifidobacterium xylocopae]|uniref:Uncharacterized protein n=1 Tax=Bifidobacterium xylocopae TaxID=2493119 RepID=A0A366KDR9_9BIFI|nr:hypothetical protein CRD59_01335 [Bifidobacterium xylocopae]
MDIIVAPSSCGTVADDRLESRAAVHGTVRPCNDSEPMGLARADLSSGPPEPCPPFGRHRPVADANPDEAQRP